MLLPWDRILCLTQDDTLHLLTDAWGPDRQMTEQELLRTALILPPRARAVLCVWAAIPGLLLCAPFVFWQSLFAGLCFCAVWGLLVLALRLRACSFVAALSPRSLTVQAGIAFPVMRQIPAGP